MTTSELLILILGATLTTVVGVASYFMVKWVDRVDAVLAQNCEKIDLLNLKVERILHLESTIPDTIKAELLRQIASLRSDPPQYKKLDKIDADVQRIYLTVFRQVLPKLEAQEKNFGRVIVLEHNNAAFEKKLYTMYEAVTQLLAERKKGQ